MDLTNWALRISPKFTTGVKYQFHQGFFFFYQIRGLVHSVNLLDAVRFVHKACERVTEKTIRNCFRHAGIIQDEVPTEIECSVASREQDEDYLSLNGCGKLTVLILLLDGFSSVDGDILAAETLTAEHIVTEVNKLYGHTAHTFSRLLSDILI